MKLASAVSDLRRQIAANPRLQLALPVLAALLALIMWQELDSWRLQAERAAQTERARLQRMESLRGQDEWLQRAQQSSTVREALLAELPEVATAGLARAAVQSEAAAMARALGGRTEPRIDVQTVADPALPADVIRIRATLSGAMSPQQAMDLLQRIEGSANLAAIEQADIRSDTNRLATFVYSAYFRLASAAGEATP